MPGDIRQYLYTFDSQSGGRVLDLVEARGAVKHLMMQRQPTCKPLPTTSPELSSSKLSKVNTSDWETEINYWQMLEVPSSPFMFRQIYFFKHLKYRVPYRLTGTICVSVISLCTVWYRMVVFTFYSVSLLNIFFASLIIVTMLWQIYSHYWLLKSCNNWV